MSAGDETRDLPPKTFYGQSLLKRPEAIVSDRRILSMRGSLFHTLRPIAAGHSGVQVAGTFLGSLVKLRNVIRIFNSHFNLYCLANQQTKSDLPAVRRQSREPIAIICYYYGDSPLD